MSTDLPFLIAHRVRNEPAFDIAIKMPCPECEAHSQAFDDGSFTWGCDECDHEGYWWICSTSGHRAYPYWSCKLEDCLVECAGEYESITYGIDEMPKGIPDHYRVNASPKTSASNIGRSILASLGLSKSSSPIKRRI